MKGGQEGLIWDSGSSIAFFWQVVIMLSHKKEADLVENYSWYLRETRVVERLLNEH